MLPCIGLKNQIFVILLIFSITFKCLFTNYADRRMVLTKNSALALIHYMEIPTIMWVYSGANLSTTQKTITLNRMDL